MSPHVAIAVVSWNTRAVNRVVAQTGAAWIAAAHADLALTPPAPAVRVLPSGGPDDRAVFTCGCGYLFEARVTASVGCPRCGEHQAW
jgi:hypothetical protein